MFHKTDTVKRKDFKAPPNHLQTLIDGINLFNYAFFAPGDELRDALKDIFDQVQFYGNKVLKIDKDLDTKWYNAYKDICNAVLAFVLERVSTVRVWSSKEPAAGAEAYFKSIMDAAVSGKVPESSSSNAPESVSGPPAPGKSIVFAGPNLAGLYQKEV